MKLHRLTGAASLAAAILVGPAAVAAPDCFENDCDVRIVSPPDGSLLSTSMPKFFGYAAPNAEVELIANCERHLITADAEGRWVWAPAAPLNDGVQRIAARADNKTSEINLEIDTLPPAVTILSPVADSTRTALNLVARGQVEPGAELEVTLDGEPVEVTVDPDGTWIHVGAREVIDGDHAITAIARDRAGNFSATKVGFHVDRRAPAVHISSPRAGFIASAPNAIAGFAESGAKLRIQGPGVDTELVVPASGRWVHPLPPVGEGNHHYRVVATDSVGWSAEDMVEVVVDTTAPALAVAQTFDRPVSESLLRLSGSAEPNSVVTIETELGEIGSDKVSATGRWEVVTHEPLPDGLHGLVITSTDRAGNATFMMTSVLVDTIAPLLDLNDIFDSGKTIKVSGFAEPRALVDVYVNDEVAAMTLAGGDGRWTAEVVAPEGLVNLEVVALDAAGNTTTLTHRLRSSQTEVAAVDGGCSGSGQAPALMVALLSLFGLALRRQRA